MPSALTLTCRRCERSGALEARVREFGERLRRCNDRIRQCHVIVLGAAEHLGGDGSVEVKIHLSLPGAQIHADSLDIGTAHTDVFIALRDAYDSARSQLRDLQRDSGSSSLVGR